MATTQISPLINPSLLRRTPGNLPFSQEWAVSVLYDAFIADTDSDVGENIERLQSFLARVQVHSHYEAHTDRTLYQFAWCHDDLCRTVDRGIQVESHQMDAAETWLILKYSEEWDGPA